MPTNIYQPLMWVDSEAEARNRYVTPGTTVLLMDRNAERFYIKSTALTGQMTSFRIFEFTEVFPQPEQTTVTYPDFVTKEDFTAAIDELKELISKKSTRSTSRGNA